MTKDKRKPKNGNGNGFHKEAWFKCYWRPAAAWVYLFICLFDFVLAPVFFGWFSWFTKMDMKEWTPLTIQGGAIFHISFGAILGLYTWNRTKEKIAEVSESAEISPVQEPDMIYETKKPESEKSESVN